MARALPDGVVIVGGTSAGRDFSAVRPSYQFAGDVVTDDGVAILLFSGALSVSTAVGTGWRTLGAMGSVTGSASGAVLEIDHRPATEFLGRYLDVTGPASFGNPLSVTEAGGDEPYYRAITGTDPGIGSVFVAGEVPIGAVVQLTTADTDDILGGTRAALNRAVDGFPAGVQPEAALIFSCAVRRFLLGSRTRVETEIARSILGSTLELPSTMRLVKSSKFATPISGSVFKSQITLFYEPPVPQALLQGAKVCSVLRGGNSFQNTNSIDFGRLTTGAEWECNWR
jgi:hypothetical protein